MRLVVTIVAATLAAGAPSDPSAALVQARVKIRAMARDLEKYVCVETVARSYYQAADSCSPGGASSTAGRRLESTDRTRLEVTVSGGHELHSWPGATGFDTRNVDELVRNGTVSTGSFGGDLANIFDNPGVAFRYLGQQREAGGTLLEYGYEVPLAASRFVVRSGGAWQPVAYEGEFWLDAKSLDLKRLSLRTREVAPAAALCRAATTLDYQMLPIGDSTVLLPRQSRLDVAQPGGRETSNQTTFANCREYQAESQLVFDAPAEESASGSRRGGRGRVALPIGLPVTLALVAPIDTDHAAMGDPVAARVVKPVRRPGSDEDLIPAGAVVHGRIRRVEHHLLPKPYFLIAIAFNRVEIGNKRAAFAARHDADAALAKSLGAELALHTSGIWYWDVGTFLFPTSKPRYVMPAGFESKWFTLAAGRR